MKIKISSTSHIKKILIYKTFYDWRYRLCPSCVCPPFDKQTCTVHLRLTVIT